MKMVKAYLVFGCVLALMAGVAQADNLLLNSDLETGDFANWILSGEGAGAVATVQVGDNGPSAAGTHSAFLDNQAQAQALVMKQSTEVGAAISGSTLYSFDLKLDQADVGGVVFVEIFAEQEGVGIIGGSGLMGPFWPWNAWTNYNGSFTAPAGTNFLTIQIEAVTGAAAGTNCRVHVDNVSLDQGTVATEPMTWSGVKALYR